MNYQTCLSRYAEIFGHYEEAINHRKLILDKVPYKEEMPFNFLIHIFNNTHDYLQLGKLEQVESCLRVLLKENELKFTSQKIKAQVLQGYLYLIKREFDLFDNLMQELEALMKKAKIKITEEIGVLRLLVFKYRLEKKYKKAMNLEKKITIEKQNILPQLHSYLDLCTLYLLLNKKKKALKLLKKQTTTFLKDGKNIDELKIYLSDVYLSLFDPQLTEERWNGFLQKYFNKPFEWRHALCLMNLHEIITHTVFHKNSFVKEMLTKSIESIFIQHHSKMQLPFFVNYFEKAKVKAKSS